MKEAAIAADRIGNSGIAPQGDLFRFFAQFPFPVQIYRPDGTLIYVNKLSLDLLHIPSADAIVGKFNALRDPLIDAWGENIREIIRKSFEGESVQFQEVRVPFSDILSRFDPNTLCLDYSLQNITCFPVFGEDGEIAYVVHLFLTVKQFHGKDEVVRARQYIEENWLEPFDLERVAHSVNLSRYHFARLFKKHTSMTPYAYYQEYKVKMVKRALQDLNLTIGEAFAACGVDYSGNYARIFRERVGMTPTQYRRSTLPPDFAE